MGKEKGERKGCFLSRRVECEYIVVVVAVLYKAIIVPLSNHSDTYREDLNSAIQGSSRQKNQNKTK